MYNEFRLSLLLSEKYDNIKRLKHTNKNYTLWRIYLYTSLQTLVIGSQFISHLNWMVYQKIEFSLERLVFEFYSFIRQLYRDIILEYILPRAKGWYIYSKA